MGFTPYGEQKGVTKMTRQHHISKQIISKLWEAEVELG